MKIPDIGDVMNKFEVLGIVGEGEKSLFASNVLKNNLHAVSLTNVINY